MKQALTIAGSDSGGGAGIQADLKTFHAHGVFGTSAITSVTAQNTKAVQRAFNLPVEMVRAQIDAVLDDFDIDAVKTGMLASVDIVAAVAAALRERGVEQLVVDPVMISKSGYDLLAEEAVVALANEVLPLALVVTPNIAEASALSALAIESAADVREAAKRIHDLGPRYVLVKGGHADFDRAADTLFDGQTFDRFEADFIDTQHTHGTGCTYSAAITARLARGESVRDAVAGAKRYITRAIAEAPGIGSGHGPTHHFYFLNPEAVDKD